MELHKPETDLNRPLKTDSGHAEPEVRKLLDEYHEAVINQDIDKIMTFYSADVVAFDMVPPLQYVGREAYRKSWEKAFESGSENVKKEDTGYDVTNMKIVASNDVAFAFALNHCYGPMNDGTYMDMWMRSTQCLKKINGKWLIVHEQYSLPTDFETGESIMNAKPEDTFH